MSAEAPLSWKFDVHFRQHARSFFQSEFLFRFITYVRETYAVSLLGNFFRFQTFKTLL